MAAPGPPSMPRSPPVTDQLMLYQTASSCVLLKMMRKTLVKDERVLTGHGQVRVGLHFSRHVPGEALKHAGVVGQEAVHLQAAPDQDSVPQHLHRVDGQSILVPDDVGLRRSCDRPSRLASGKVSKIINAPTCAYLVPGRECPPPSPSPL